MQRTVCVLCRRYRIPQAPHARDQLPVGSITRPMNRIIPVSMSRITKMNACSITIIDGMDSVIDTPVAAAASVPSSFTET